MSNFFLDAEGVLEPGKYFSVSLHFLPRLKKPCLSILRMMVSCRAARKEKIQPYLARSEVREVNVARRIASHAVLTTAGVRLALT